MRRALALHPFAAIALIAFAFALALAADPPGNFPVDDDWAYAHSVQWLLGEHRIRLSDWVAMNLLPQTLAGGFVTLVGGFSFERLRHLTQFVSVAVAMLALAWFRVAGLRRTASFVATLTLVAAPCWLPLADSFMTDLYAMLFALPAATLFLRALRERTPRTIAWATPFAALGLLQRQVVLVVPVAFWICVGVLAAFGFAALCRTALVAARTIVARRHDAPQIVFLITLVAAYLAPFVLTDFIDRYCVFVLPFVLALIGIVEPAASSSLRRRTAMLVLVVAFAVEAAATHDYFAWNRARWDAIRDAEARGATASTLDGGFEYNGY